MIQITEIEISGQAEAGPFSGRMTFGAGLNVISARNAYGKSLATKTVPWCLGLESLFGRPNNDPSLFPRAVTEAIDLAGAPRSRVIRSACSLSLVRHDRARIRITRDIKGDPTTVSIEETNAQGETVTSKMMARALALQDEHGGLQSFLFSWFGWPRQRVMTFKGKDSDVYAENLAPLFYIEQNHGWGDLQATQIGRYQQQQISEVAVEYLLGATSAIEARFKRNQAQFRDAALREAARLITERISTFFAKQGWVIEWSGNGPVHDIETRWRRRSLTDAVVQDTEVDLTKDRARLSAEVERLRQMLSTGHLDVSSVAAPAGASQRAIELKQRRHEVNLELRTLRAQLDEAREVAHGLEHRLQTAHDVLRLVKTGVGRIAAVECPTCHRDLDAAAFSLSSQSEESISAHIEALKRDIDLMRNNVHSLERARVKLHAESERVDIDFREAERALSIVNEAVGPAREQLADIANRLTSVERTLDRIEQTAADLKSFQEEVDSWLKEASAAGEAGEPPADLAARVEALTGWLRQYLVAWGHSEVKASNASSIHLDDRYEPYLNDLRLKSLGSASDGARLIAAYTLALAAASADERVRGYHPGAVVLDEPLQQNPDDEHRRLFVAFLRKHVAQAGAFQTLIFTSLLAPEIEDLHAHNVHVAVPKGEHFLTRGIESPESATEKDGNALPDPTTKGSS